MLAERSGVGERTIAGAEAGSRGISIAVLDRLLTCMSMDLVLAPSLSSSDPTAVRRHLRRSLTSRLRLGLGEQPSIYAAPRTPAWAELVALARVGRVVVAPPLAVALWLPLGTVAPIQVSLHDLTHPSPPTHFVDVEVSGSPVAADLVAVAMSVGTSVWVPTPAALTMPTHQNALLRHADLLLHAEAPVDDAGRRRPPHRDPAERDEDWRLLVTKGAGALQRPDLRDSRAWRLGAAASLAQRLRGQ